MLDGLRAEFPELSRIAVPRGRLRVSPEPPWWAFISATGAAFIVGGVVQVAAMVVYPLIFPPTEPGPPFAPAAIADVSAALAAAAVALRAGGGPALVAYAAFELMRILAGMPGRMVFCERSGGPGSPALPAAFPCDVPGVLASEWPLWTALVAGALLSKLLLSRADSGANHLLRGAGLFAFILTATGMGVGVLTAGGLLGTQAGDIDSQLTLNNLFTVAEIAAGVAAGIALTRASFAGPLLVILLLAFPLAYALPLALRPGPIGSEPTEMTLMRWSGVYVPALAAAAILGARGYLRRRRGGTFF